MSADEWTLDELQNADYKNPKTDTDKRVLAAVAQNDYKHAHELIVDPETSLIKPRTADIVCKQLTSRYSSIPGKVNRILALDICAFYYFQTENSAFLPKFSFEDNEYSDFKNEIVHTCISVVHLVISRSDEGKNQQKPVWWPVFMPFVLRYLEKTQSEHRLRGTLTVLTLCRKFPEYLAKSGLAKPLEALVEPLMYFLPPLTPPETTIRVFKPSIECLFLLAEIQNKSDKNNLNSRFNYLTRQGVLNAFLHSADNNVALVSAYFQTLTEVVDTWLKTLAIAHLQPIVKLFNHIMLDPFMYEDSEIGRLACTMMKTLILYTWPRIGVYKYNILLALKKSGKLNQEWCDLLDLPSDEAAELLILPN